jgi:hypothetical protein
VDVTGKDALLEYKEDFSSKWNLTNNHPQKVMRFRSKGRVQGWAMLWACHRILDENGLVGVQVPFDRLRET